METTENIETLDPPWELELELELRDHIQHCSCSCNHMGYGNSMDYRQTTLHELPDVTEPHCNGGVPRISQTHRLSVESLSESSARRIHRNLSTCICVLLCVIAGALAAGFGLPLALGGSGSRSTPQQRLHIVRRLFHDQPLIDGHNDLPWNVRRFAHNRLAAVNLTARIISEPWRRSPWSQTDILRLKEGLIGAQFWSAYVPCAAQGLDAVQIALEQIDLIRRLADYYSNHLSLVTTVHGIVTTHQEGRIASLIGVEGGHVLGGSLAVLRTIHALGARYLTLTHSCDTPWAGSSGSTEGLSAFGKEVIREMNRLGMIIDLSHASTFTVRDVLKVTHAPVIFSHSSARSLCNSSRNVPDDILRLVAENNGLVMISFYSLLISCGRSATIRDVIAHINHIRAIAGAKYVGIGAGYDGIDSTPRGLEDVSKYPHLFVELLEDPSWSEGEVADLAGGNFLRVFRAVETVREQWRKAAVQASEEIDRPNKSDCSYMPS